MSADAMVDEFDTYATWTADAVAELGPEHALPAACRGSGSPAALDWLASRLRLGAGATLLDSGAGVGGPAQYAVETTGADVVLVDPMVGACRAARRMFGHRVAVGDGARLPVGDASADAAWSLGVLCTVDDAARVRHLAELRRVVRPEGRVGLLVFERHVEPEDLDPPEGNDFPSPADLDDALRRAGLQVLDDVAVADLAPAPEEWGDLADAVDDVVRREHGDHEAFRTATRQSEQIGRLLGEGRVAGRLLACAPT
jgi:SAM-dependent methyltransferase